MKLTREQLKSAENVPGVKELFTPDAFAHLENDTALKDTVYSLRAREKDIAGLLAKADPSAAHRACQTCIAQMQEENAAGALPLTPGDPASFSRAVDALPRIPSTAALRRHIRETARVYRYLSEGPLFLPLDTDDFHKLWELAMDGEPRWSEDWPSSAFRKNMAVVLDSILKQNVLMVCSAPEDIERDISALLTLLLSDALLPEVRAVCAFAMFEWIHPFSDGNGHTGRMLMLAALCGRYSVPTLVCFSSELVIRKYLAKKAFGPLRSGEGRLNDFCGQIFSQFENAQEEALHLLREAVPDRSPAAQDRRNSI